MKKSSLDDTKICLYGISEQYVDDIIIYSL